MAKHKRHVEDPKIEDFVGVPKRWSTRRSITLWIDGDIINACKPKPAKTLRQWIENTFPPDGLP